MNGYKELSEEQMAELFKWFEDTMQPIIEAIEKGVIWLVEVFEKLMETEQ